MVCGVNAKLANKTAHGRGNLRNMAHRGRERNYTANAKPLVVS